MTGQRTFAVEKLNTAPLVMAQEEGGVDPAGSAIDELAPVVGDPTSGEIDPAEGETFSWITGVSYFWA